MTYASIAVRYKALCLWLLKCLVYVATLLSATFPNRKDGTFNTICVYTHQALSLWLYTVYVGMWCDDHEKTYALLLARHNEAVAANRGQLYCLH